MSQFVEIRDEVINLCVANKFEMKCQSLKCYATIFLLHLLFYNMPSANKLTFFPQDSSKMRCLSWV